MLVKERTKNKSMVNIYMLVDASEISWGANISLELRDEEKMYLFPCSEVSFYMTTEKQPFKKMYLLLKNCDFRIVMLVFGGSNYIKWFAVFLPTLSLCVWRKIR